MLDNSLRYRRDFHSERADYFQKRIRPRTLAIIRTRRVHQTTVARQTQ